jgi:chaperonin GroEL
MSIILYADEARERVKKGVDMVVDAAKVTLGAKGKTVVIGRVGFNTVITKDGATVVKSISAKDSIENLGVQMVKDLAIQTNTVLGDGSTTVSILLQAIIEWGFKAITPSINRNNLTKGIELATKTTVNKIKKLAKKADTRKLQIQIATISANGNKEVGELVVDTLEKVGEYGVVRVEESSNNKTTVDCVTGMKIDNGYMSPYFMTNYQKAQLEFKNPYIFLYDGYIENIRDIIEIMKVSVDNARPMLIIAEEVEATTLSTIVSNWTAGQLRVATVKAVGFGDRRRNILEDIAILTGGTVLSKDLGKTLADFTLDMLGECSDVIVTKDNTSIIGGAGDLEKIKQRVELLSTQISTDEEGHEKENKKERLAKLAGGVAVINVGGNSPIEIKELYDRIEDAVCATRAAISGGYVAGGGNTYLACLSELDDLKTANPNLVVGIDVIYNAIKAPWMQILHNAGIDSIVLPEIKYGYGLDVISEKEVNLFKVGIIDPADVTINALINASSVANTFIGTETVIMNEEDFM